MEEQGKMGMGMGMREYRKGNWTIQETMILIEAKKMDDERRKLSKKQAYHNIITTTSSPSSSNININTSTSMSTSMKPVTELRWKWVEEYCWRKGCLRSQNQCNDKWDNLMRDYKKIRDFSRSLLIIKGDNYDQNEEIKVKSYWEMDKVERKDKGLPTNMLPQIYQALFDVVEGSSGGGSGSTTPSSVGVVSASVAAPTQFLQLPPPSPPVPLRLDMTQLPFYSPQSQVQVQPQSQPVPLVSPTLELEASEQSQPESSAKRRRKEERAVEASIREGTSTDAPTTTTTTTTTTTPTLQDVSSAICRSASIISEAIQTNEQNEERRHKEIMHVHEARLRFEESRLEVTRQGFNGLNDAINKLANSILTWANTSHRSHQGP